MVLQELGLRTFKEKDGVIVESTKKDCPVAKRIPYREFLKSKPYFTNNRVMDVNAHQVLENITQAVEEITGITDRHWGEVVVYRDKFDVHGYSEKYQENSQSPVLHPNVGIEEVAFSRIITKIPLIGDNDHQTGIAFKWEAGLCQISIGMNVAVCDNWNIMQRSAFYETSKDFDYAMVMGILRKELRAIEERHQMNIQLIAQLMDKQVSDKQLMFLLGEIMYRYGREDQVINVTDLTEVQRNIHRRREKEGAVRNLWDFTNCVTDVLKFDKSSGESVLESIQKANTFINAKLLPNAAN